MQFRSLLVVVLFGFASGVFAESIPTPLKPIFNGKDLSGWAVPEGNAAAGWYKAVDGVLKIQSGPKKKGSILWTQKKYRNFLMEFDFRMGEGRVDSGVHLRNPDQIQIGISGSLGRDMTCSPYIPGKGYPVEAKNIKKLLKPKGWNTMRIQAIGREYTVWLAGEKVMTYQSASAIAEGPIGLQLHGGRNMAIDYRNIKLIELPATASVLPVIYEGSGKGIGAGKHIVFIASDHEYRAEETCPALARILAKHHGFKTTVVLGVDKDGYIEAGSSNIPGTEALKDADGLVIFARFLNPSAEQMKPLIAYLDRAGPVVGLRTSSHAFKIPADSQFAKFDFRSKVKGYENGFGHQILGNTWVGHYGRNHRQGSRIQIIPEQKGHVILTGVKDNAFCFAGGYMGHAHEGFTVLTKTQPLVALKPDAAPDKTKPAVPSTWTRHYTAKNGKRARVFHSTQGASEDILDASYRRMLINGILWSIGLEDKIAADLKIDFVGAYNPLPYTNAGHAQKVKPADLAGFKSPIMPQGKAHKPKRTVKRN
jgi:hypothetical protein